MNTTQERLSSRLKVIERFKTNFPWFGNPVNLIGSKSSGKSQTQELPAADSGPVKEEETAETMETNRPPKLQDLLEATGAQAAYSVIFGVCEDGLPLTLNLTSSAPGAILIAGDPSSGKTRLIRAILYSASLINSVDQAVFYLLAADKHEYTDLAELGHTRQLAGFAEVDCLRILQDLSTEAEKRRNQPSDLQILIAIDDILPFVKTLGTAQLEQLHRLIKHGPRLGIWVIAALAADDIAQADEALVQAFRTHLLGYLDDAPAAAYLAQDENCPAEQLEKGEQFCAAVGGDWYLFRVCDPAGGG